MQTQDVGIVPTRVVWDSERVRQMRSALDNASLRLELVNPYRRHVMDEIERAQALKNLNILIDQIAGESTKGALRVVSHILHDLNAKFESLVQELEDDE